MLSILQKSTKLSFKKDWVQKGEACETRGCQEIKSLLSTSLKGLKLCCEGQAGGVTIQGKVERLQDVKEMQE